LVSSASDWRLARDVADHATVEWWRRTGGGGGGGGISSFGGGGIKGFLGSTSACLHGGLLLLVPFTCNRSSTFAGKLGSRSLGLSSLGRSSNLGVLLSFGRRLGCNVEWIWMRKNFYGSWCWRQGRRPVGLEVKPSGARTDCFVNVVVGLDRDQIAIFICQKIWMDVGLSAKVSANASVKAATVVGTRTRRMSSSSCALTGQVVGVAEEEDIVIFAFVGLVVVGGGWQKK